LLLAALLFAWGTHSISFKDLHLFDDGEFYSSTTKDQPLVKIVDDFLHRGYLENLRSWVTTSRHVIKNPLNGGFSTTYGLVIDYKLENKTSAGWKSLEDKFERTDLSILIPLLRQQTPDDDECNGFVTNILIVPQDEGVYEDNEYSAVDWHFDVTLDIQVGEEVDLLPYEVAVMYVRIPTGMNGGELEIQYEFLSPNGEQFIPRQNRHLTFRGDSYHRVQGFTNDNNNGKRISIVTEKYKVPQEYLYKVPVLEVNSEDEFEMNSKDELQMNSKHELQMNSKDELQVNSKDMMGDDDDVYIDYGDMYDADDDDCEAMMMLDDDG